MLVLVEISTLLLGMLAFSCKTIAPGSSCFSVHMAITIFLAISAAYGKPCQVNVDTMKSGHPV